jgi:coniferyl-aldehyde dehydrogenase
MAVIETSPDASALAALRTAWQAQRAAVARDPRPTAAERRERVVAVADAVVASRLRIREALREDFGSHPALFADLGETLAIAARAAHAAEHLAAWMAPEPRAVDPTLCGTAWAQSRPEPLGVIGSIVPWSAPFQLGLGPLIDMLAAGNRVIVKPSHRTPACAELLREILRGAVAQDVVDVAVGGLELAHGFARLPWDQLVFAGGAQAGRAVALAAAESLVPVRLELGGKCPALVLDDAVDATTVEQIVGAKMIGNGQLHAAIDHCLVPRGRLDELVALALDHVARTQPDYSATSDCTGSISDDHLARTLWLLDEARDAGCTVVQLDRGGALDRRVRRVPLSIVLDPPPQLDLVREEVRGPILPVHGYDCLDEALEAINAGPPPPALYVFTHDALAAERVLDATRSRGAGVNAAVGRHHGSDGFHAFSRPRHVFVRGHRDQLDLLVPPYDERQQAHVDDALAAAGARRFARGR